MIQACPLNIVFDIGGVVVRWEPDAIIAAVFDDPADRLKVRRQFVGHEDWLALDRGTLAPDRAVLRASQRTGLPRLALERFLARVPSELVAIPATVDLMHRLKTKNHKLFCLSNMQFASIEHLERVYSFWHLFDGIVVSCRINAIKPEAAIYAHLLDRYQLNPRETVLIDDVAANLAGAAHFNIRTIQFDNPAQCEQQLQRLGCL
jgi:putative hydrolase of the HAD superfamily